MYLHPTGILGATPDIFLGEEGVLEVKTLPMYVSNLIIYLYSHFMFMMFIDYNSV